MMGGFHLPLYQPLEPRIGGTVGLTCPQDRTLQAACLANKATVVNVIGHGRGMIDM
jgi:hypothetical protein